MQNQDSSGQQSKLPSETPSIVEKQPVPKKKRVFTTKMVAYTAMFLALSTVCNCDFPLGMINSLKITVSYLPNFLAGALLGPLPGFLCGFFGDLFGCFLFPQGEINPVILLSSGLLGLIPGVVFRLFRGKDKSVRYPVVAAIVSVIAVFLICTNLNTLAFYLFYIKGNPKYESFWAYYVYRTPKQVVIWAVNAFLCVLLYLPLKKLIKLDSRTYS